MAGSDGAAGSDGLVLVLNWGSSSVKFALLTPDTGERVLGGEAEQVGTPEAVLRIRRYPADAVSQPLPDGSYQAVISRILDHLADADETDRAGALRSGAGVS
jgi:acetate kinase